MYEIAVKHTEPETVAFLDTQGPYSLMPERLDLLYKWVVAHGLKPIGMPHAVYLTPAETPVSEAEWELQAPVAPSSHLKGPDRNGIGVKRLDSITVAFAMHKGPYDSVGTTYERLTNWIAENDYEITGPPEEIYFSDPEDTPPDEYLTEVRIPVRERD